MTIEFHCPQCEKLLRVPDGTEGKKAKCPQCSTVVVIPAANESDGIDELLADIPASPPPVPRPPSDNPFQPPSTPGRLAAGDFKRGELRKIASLQKVILICMGLQLTSVLLLFRANQQPGAAAAVVLLVLVAGLVATIYTFRLAMVLFGTGAGLGLGVLAMVPGFGLISLLIVVIKATTVLKRNGIKVTLYGANMSQFD